MRYLLVDTANTFFRARHSAHRQSDTWDKLGFAIHVTLASINKSWRDQKADHVIFCLEGRSWRKDFYEPYKKNRSVARAALTESEAEEDRLFWETFDNLKTFVAEKTNCSVLQHNELEADDLIAGWIQSHPDDHHTIISSDTDFYQLLADNVNQYNGISDELHTLKGIFDKKGKPVIDKKTKEPKKIPNPQFILFEKCMRGDPTDNVFSAFPGVRTKGSKNKVGLEEAYSDKDKKGYNWNNMMLQRWVDHNGVEHRVLDDYERNRILVDLTAQPDDIKVKMAETIAAAQVPKNMPMVGAQFLKFCGKYDLVKLSENASNMAEWMMASYPQKDYVVRKWYIDPQEPISEFINDLTGITDADIRAESYSHEHVARELGELIKEHKCFINPVTWGGGDSVELLAEFCKNHADFPHFGRRWIDVKTWYTYLMLTRGKAPSGGLSSAMGYFKLQFKGKAHRADVDAANTLALFFKLLDRQARLESILDSAKNI